MLIRAGLLFIVYVSAWVMQSHLLLKGDVSWLTHLARLTLRGGTYVNAYFEINPPLSIYLYYPVAYFLDWTGFDVITSIRVYIFIVASFSLWLCYLVAKKYITQSVMLTACLITLAIVYLIVPLYEFGQRENLAVMCVMPYLFCMALRLDRQSLPWWLCVLVGFSAGIGFSAKPFFMAVFFLIEGYYVISMRAIKVLFRIETFCIVAFTCSYLLAIWYAHPDYLKVIVPLARQFYYMSHAKSWYDMLSNLVVIYCLLVPAYCMICLNKISGYRSLMKVLALAVVGFLIAYFVQRISWYYHLYPALAMSVIFFVFACGIALAQLRTVGAIFIVFMFYIPFWLVSNGFKGGYVEWSEMQPLINYVYKQGHQKPVYFFSAKAAYMVSVLEHAGAYHPSRLQFLQWLNCYYQCPPEKLRIGSPYYSEYLKTSQYLIDMLAEDIERSRPAIILVDNTFYESRRGLMRFDYLALLNQNAHFNKVWRAYSYLMVLNGGKAEPFSYKVYVDSRFDSRS